MSSPPTPEPKPAAHANWPGGTRGALVEAMLAYKAGEYLDAVRIYRKILDAEPRNKEALHHFGMALYQLGRREDAKQLITASLHVDERQADAHLNLARIHFNEARYALAFDSIARARRIAGDGPEAMELLGRCHAARGAWNDAAEVFAAAVASAPDDLALALRLAEACDTAGRSGEAITWYRYVLERDPTQSQARIACTLVLRRGGRAEEALSCLRDGLVLDPEDVELRHNEAAQLDEMGRFEEARAGYRAVLAGKPDHALALGSLLRMKGYETDAALAQRAAAIARNPEAAQFDRVFLHYSLGRYYDHHARYDDAFANYRAANALQASTFPYLAPALERYADAAIRRFTAETCRDPEGYDHEDAGRPIFIVGMPRSGTTLTEQILASHSAVFGGGEIDYFVARFGRGFEGRTAPGHPRKLSRLGQEELAGVRQGYLDRLRALDDRHAHVTDKMPFNFLHLGLIHRAFPAARIVHCVRDPLDNLLSCYFENLSGDFSFAMSFERLAHYYAQYRRLMRHWTRVLGDRLLTLPYEELVADVESASRRLVRFCGLSWEDDCLRFYETPRAITTPSNWQVRQPIYQSSISRWKHYERHLAPLREALGKALGDLPDRRQPAGFGAVTSPGAD